MNKFAKKQETTTKVWSIGHSKEERRSFVANWPYPFGFREFIRSAALLVGAVVSDDYLLLAPCRYGQTHRNAVAEILGDRF